MTLVQELVEALERFLESSACRNGCSPDDMTCNTSFARSVLARAKSATATGCDHKHPALPFKDPNCRECSTGTAEFTVTDDCHGRAMVGGRRLAYGGMGLTLNDKDEPRLPRVLPGDRVLVELREGTDFATLVKVLP